MNSFLMSAIAGAATSLGGLVVCCLPQSRSVPASLLASTLSLAAGVMLAVSMLELVVPATSKGEWWAGIYFLGGCVAYSALASLARWIDQLQTNLIMAKVRERRNRRLGILMALALTVHNLPEGLAVAVSATVSRRTGLVVTIAIALHNIPEGIVIAVPLFAASSRSIAILTTIASGLSEPLGAILGILLMRHVKLTNHVVDNVQASVAGIMTCVALLELLPEAYAQHRFLPALFGFLAGWLVIFTTIWLLDSRHPFSYLDSVLSATPL